MKTEEEKINPQHAQVRNVLRKLGPTILIIGLLFMAVGMISFFSAMSGSGSPEYFWCCFVGMPLVFIGGVMSKFAYIGAVARFMSAETAPVGKDTFITTWSMGPRAVFAMSLVQFAKVWPVNPINDFALHVTTRTKRMRNSAVSAAMQSKAK